MINELSDLSAALEKANISTERWHREYKPIPNITKKNPCVHIVFDQGKIKRIGSIDAETGKELRKYGDNQGSYPAMNLQPLYRVVDKKSISLIRDIAEGKRSADSNALRALCTDNNWDSKFEKKYKICLRTTPDKLKGIFDQSIDFPWINILICETEKYSASPALMHQAIQDEAFSMIEKKINIDLAIRILFHLGNSEKIASNDRGKLSILFDCQSLIDSGMSTATAKFTKALNEKLLELDQQESNAGEDPIYDAFGKEFYPFEEPMPSVKLAGGFDTTLRTMFRGQPCQERYGRTDDQSYPLSKREREKLAGALGWISSEKNKDITWSVIGNKEILFVYPFQLPSIQQSYVRMFKKFGIHEEDTFEQEAKLFIELLQGQQSQNANLNANKIRIFILRKIDKARTKIIYTRNSDPQEIEQRSQKWSSGTINLPQMSIGRTRTLFPLETADILNRSWKQNGDLISDQFRPIPGYHGMELFFGYSGIYNDLSILIRNTAVIAPLIGTQITMHEKIKINEEVKQSISLIGLLLSQMEIMKEDYMQEFPYLYGQLLKISDELHLLYCEVVRDGNIPSQLAGSSIYMSVPDSPVRSMGILGDRMNPYIHWARAYQYKKESKSGIARWLLYLYDQNAQKMSSLINKYSDKNFTDTDKAVFFLGYLAAFPKKEEEN